MMGEGRIGRDCMETRTKGEGVGLGFKRSNERDGTEGRRNDQSAGWPDGVRER